MCSFENLNGNLIIKIQQNNSLIHLIPVYINCNSWMIEFEKLDNLFH